MTAIFVYHKLHSASSLTLFVRVVNYNFVFRIYFINVSARR